jgi:hypothetical protein
VLRQKRRRKSLKRTRSPTALTRSLILALVHLTPKMILMMTPDLKAVERIRRLKRIVTRKSRSQRLIVVRSRNPSLLVEENPASPRSQRKTVNLILKVVEVILVLMKKNAIRKRRSLLLTKRRRPLVFLLGVPY